MELAREILGEIASVSQRLIDATVVRLGREGGEPVEMSLIVLLYPNLDRILRYHIHVNV